MKFAALFLWCFAIHHVSSVEVASRSFRSTKAISAEVVARDALTTQDKKQFNISSVKTAMESVVTKKAEGSRLPPEAHPLGYKGENTEEQAAEEAKTKLEAFEAAEEERKIAEKKKWLAEWKAKTPYTVFFIMICLIFTIILVMFLLGYFPLITPIPGSKESPSFMTRLFLRHKNPGFADDLELACRGAFFVLLIGAPFIFYSHPFEAIHDLVSNGYFTSSAIVYFIYTLYKTVGETVSFAWGGIMGTFWAVFVVWLLYGFYPLGVTEHMGGHAFFVGTSVGIAFVISFLLLNVGISTSIFSLATWVYFWMAFLEPTKDEFSHSFQINLRGTAINCLLQCGVGCFVAILASLLPTPRWALTRARNNATALQGLLSKLLVDFHDGMRLESQLARSEELQAVKEELDVVRDHIATLRDDISHSWWECFGFGRRQHSRMVLERLNGFIFEAYDCLRGALNCLSEVEGSKRAEFMKAMDKDITSLDQRSVELLSSICVCGVDGALEAADRQRLRSLHDSLVKSCQSFTTKFEDTKNTLGSPGFSHELVDEHVFCFSVCTFARQVVGLADDVLKHYDSKEEFTLRESPMPFLGGVFDRSVMFSKDQLNYVTRNSLSILLAFAIGFQGYSSIIPTYDASTAGIVSLLLSKYFGAAMVNNLNRLQGVVLGTVIGQVIYSVFGWCAVWGTITICTAAFSWSFLTLFIYYNSQQYSLLGCLLCVFALQNILRSCAAEDFQASDAYKGIVSIVMAIAIMIGVDTVFSTGRAVDKATKAITDTYNLLALSLTRHFDPKAKETRFHKGELLDMINQAKTLVPEADSEPRFYRQPFQVDLFREVLVVTRHLRFFTTYLEYTAAEERDEGGPKIPAFTQIANNSAVQPVITLLSAKSLLITNLVKIFVLDRTEFQEMLDSPVVSKQLMNKQRNEEEFQALVKNFMDSFTTGSTKVVSPRKAVYMDEDPAVLASVIAASLSHMMVKMNELHDAIMAEHECVHE